MRDSPRLRSPEAAKEIRIKAAIYARRSKKGANGKADTNSVEQQEAESCRMIERED
jgi:hypothetical protein